MQLIHIMPKEEVGSRVEQEYHLKGLLPTSYPKFPPAPPAGDQVLQHVSLWGTVHINVRTFDNLYKKKDGVGNNSQ